MNVTKFFFIFCFSALVAGLYSANKETESTNITLKKAEKTGINENSEAIAKDLNVFSPNLQDKRSNENANDYLFLWLKMFLFLAFFITGSMLLIKYMKSKNRPKGLKNDYFEIYGELPLEMNKKLQIIKIVNEFYVLAVGTDNVNFIAKIENKEGVDLLELKGSATSKLKSNFFQDVASNYFSQDRNSKKKFNALDITKNLRKKMHNLKH